MKFKDIDYGLIRATDGIVYTKLKESVDKGNAICLTSGKFRTFIDEEEVEKL